MTKSGLSLNQLVSSTPWFFRKNPFVLETSYKKRKETNLIMQVLIEATRKEIGTPFPLGIPRSTVYKKLKDYSISL
jgi:transcriptional regulator of acetoin/glycerol metabolism